MSRIASCASGLHLRRIVSSEQGETTEDDMMDLYPSKRFTFEAGVVYTIVTASGSLDRMRWVRDIPDRSDAVVCLHGFVPADSRKTRATHQVPDTAIVSVKQH